MLVTEGMPPEGNTCYATGAFIGQKYSYWLDVLGVATWYEAIDGPDQIMVGVLAWEPKESK